MSSLGSSDKPIVVIVGPTASGKSALALWLAHKYNGEIICVDSRTIYTGMDIGTAKPSIKEQQAIPHFGIDLVCPDEIFSAGQFKQYAEKKIYEIQTRDKLPIMVGGSGLYIDSVLFDYQFSESGAERDEQNPRHLKKTTHPLQLKEPRPSTCVIGLKVSKEILHERIEQRVDTMLDEGLLEEVQNLLNTYDSGAPGMLSPGYKELGAHLRGATSFDEAKRQFIGSHKRLSKRQITWFKRNKDIVWIQSFEQADNEVAVFLSKFDTIDS